MSRAQARARHNEKYQESSRGLSIWGHWVDTVPLDREKRDTLDFSRVDNFDSVRWALSSMLNTIASLLFFGRLRASLISEQLYFHSEDHWRTRSLWFQPGSKIMCFWKRFKKPQKCAPKWIPHFQSKIYAVSLKVWIRIDWHRRWYFARPNARVKSNRLAPLEE